MINYNLIDIIVSLVATKSIYHNDTHDVLTVLCLVTFFFFIIIELYGYICATIFIFLKGFGQRLCCIYVSEGQSLIFFMSSTELRSFSGINL